MIIFIYPYPGYLFWHWHMYIWNGRKYLDTCYWGEIVSPLNSLVLGRCGNNFRIIIFKLLITQNCTDEKLTLIQPLPEPVSTQIYVPIMTSSNGNIFALLPFVRGIHRSPVNSPHKGQWRGALMFSSICARINGWANNREAGDVRRHRGHYDVIAMPYYVIRPQWFNGETKQTLMT